MKIKANFDVVITVFISKMVNDIELPQIYAFYVEKVWG